MSEHQRIYAQIDLKAVESNLENIRSGLQNETKIMAVVKTDGYGHGSVPIARRLQDKEFMYGFGVATIEEAMELKKQGIRLPILVLGYTFPDCFDLLAKEEIRPALFREDHLPLYAMRQENAGNPSGFILRWIRECRGSALIRMRAACVL